MIDCAVLVAATVALTPAPPLKEPAPGAGHRLSSPDPLDDVRRADRAIVATIRLRVPDWSPEADLRRGRIDHLLSDIVDYEAIAHRALGAAWEPLSARQRAEFMRLFTALTNQTFVATLARPELRLRYESETIAGASASVFLSAVLDRPAGEVVQHLEYRLQRRADRWLIQDVLVDHASLVDGYRDQFAHVLRSGGFDELLQRMKRKLDRSHPS